MTRHLAKALDAIWYLSMGLFLGLTGGLVLSVILTFRGARAIDASPGVEPFSDPMFAEYHNDAVAGYIGQELFMVGGTVALVLLGIAFVSVSLRTLILWLQLTRPQRCKAKADHLRMIAITFCLGTMVWGAFHTVSMNEDWPSLYDAQATDPEIAERRDEFDKDHRGSELIVMYAWLSGLLALSISPWCRRLADESAATKSAQQQ